jgi:hypothetical protein
MAKKFWERVEAKIPSGTEKRMRDTTIRKAYLELGCSMASIARELAIHYSTVSKIVKEE